MIITPQQGSALAEAIVEFMLSQPGMVATLLEEHVPDHTGHCAACYWWQAPRPHWPCFLRVYATAGREAERGVGRHHGLA